MADFVYAVSAFERQRGNFPALPLINMVAEPIKMEANTSLQSRPGLEYSAVTMGSGPIRALFTADGVLNGDLFGVSNTSLYNSDTLLGDIDGDGPVSITGYQDNIFVCAGASIWSYDGTTLAAVAFPDSAPVAKILVAGSRLVAIKAGTGTFYWSDVLTSTIDSLSFATAENSPDASKDMLFIGDRLIIFGSETIEFWPITSDADLPFQPLIGSVLPIGIKDTGLAVPFNRGFAWITNYNEVCLDDPQNIISDPELQLKLGASTDTALWTFYIDDVEFLAVRVDTETWTYCARTQTWSQMTSYGAANWLPQCYDRGYFGLSSSGNLAQWSDGYSDFDGTMERRFRAWIPITSDSLTLKNVLLRTNPGTTPHLSGDYSNPVVELRTSTDGGNSWQPWKARGLGYQGQYRKKTFWSSLGQFGYPGTLVELRLSDPVSFRVSGLAYNEPFGGR